MSLANKVAPVLLKALPDKYFSVIQYLYRQRAWPHLRHPRTFNEKIQWIKLNVRDPLLTQCADKVGVRDYVRSLLPEDVLIPLLGVYGNAESVPYDALPERFVLKATHGSGWNILCHSKSSFDRKAAAEKLSKWLKMNFYEVGREWAYKDVMPRIIAEEFLADAEGNSPPDYKVFCFHGEPRYIQVDYDRFTSHTRNLYDVDWKLLPCRLEYPNSAIVDEAPEALPRMLEVARRLSARFLFVRVDLYAVRERVYFGELTFYPGKGAERFVPREYDEVFGSHLKVA